jgi:DNA polymerase-3 subunit gamma/tau
VGGSETIAEKRDEAKNALKVKANSHPFVQAVFDAFPKAEILEIRTPQDVANLVQVDALPEVEDEWDPFDDN